MESGLLVSGFEVGIDGSGFDGPWIVLTAVVVAMKEVVKVMSWVLTTVVVDGKLDVRVATWVVAVVIVTVEVGAVTCAPWGEWSIRVLSYMGPYKLTSCLFSSLLARPATFIKVL